MLPICAYCKTQPVTRSDHRYCSIRCGHAHLKARYPACKAKCGNRVKSRKAIFCSKRCAWLVNIGPEKTRERRERAVAVRRQQYVARLRERLKGMTSPGQIWRTAYQAGFRACYVGWMRKVKRGDVVLVKERMRDWNAA